MRLTPHQAADLLEADIRRAVRDIELDRLQREAAVDLALANAHLDGLPPNPFEWASILDQPQVHKAHDCFDSLHDPRLPRVNWGG